MVDKAIVEGINSEKFIEARLIRTELYGDRE